MKQLKRVIVLVIMGRKVICNILGLYRLEQWLFMRGCKNVHVRNASVKEYHGKSLEATILDSINTDLKYN
jgi:hypothetical protein